MADNDDISDLKTGLALVEKGMTDMLAANAKNAAAQSELTGSVNKLLIKIAERDIHDEYHDKRMLKVDDFIDKSLPVINRTRRSQQRYDNFISGITSGYGKMVITIVSGALLLSLAVALGIDVKLLRG